MALRGDEQCGRFITFEGGEGAGKSTQLKLLRASLEASGRAVVTERSSIGTPTVVVHDHD